MPRARAAARGLIVDRPMGSNGLTFPLVSRRRIAGLPLGGLRSSRRGPGLDLAGSRPYRPGDDFRLIDRHASARLSSMLGRDEFIVREHLTEETARVVLAADHGPSMSLFPPGLPWLSKPDAAREVARLVGASAGRARAPVEELGAASPEDALSALAARERPPGPGSFVFVVSDFLPPPPDPVWAGALGRRWDVVPVVVQDPTWEQSFPDVAGAVLPVADPGGGTVRLVRLSRSEVAGRRRENESRLEGILGSFRRLGLDWVLVSSSDQADVLQAFLGWAAGRERGARLR